ncbi:MAG TPA: ABC transporter ATP-binding protein [Pyrinomonadaceae bacterium]|nr:ABC transporter ATP-binding protein [Pyrinomonadaceae bacterium]
MSNIAIRVENLSKQYRIGERESYKALRDVIADAAAAPFRRVRSAFNGNGSSNGSALSTQDASDEMRNPKSEIRNSIWALDDVSFEVKQGEVVGIIGRNGAGKSTLLKILSRITKPTKGHAKIFGRVGSLLEVGTGFHPELTGRENIYLNGAILGMRKAEIERKFDEIVAFAEVEKFIDTPVKRYSSGMYVRLAFAVAAYMETEVLLVDEVLAVGDTAFQKKCLGKLGSIAHGGRTVLFISHNMGAVRTLCSRGIVLSSGSVEFDGSAQKAIAVYGNQLMTTSTTVDLTGRIVGRSGPKRYCRIANVSLANADDSLTSTFSMGSEMRIRVGLDFLIRGDSWEIGVGIFSNTGVAIHYMISNWEGFRLPTEGGQTTVEVRIPKLQLFPGRYAISLWLKRPGETVDDQVHEAAAFDVEEGDITGHPSYFGRYSYNTQVYTPNEWRRVI